MWEEPSAAMRTWCCFELMATAVAGNTVELALPPSELALLDRSLLDSFDHVVATCRRDIAGTNTTDPEDKTMILEWAEWQSEKRDVLKLAENALRGWVSRHACQLLEGVPLLDAARPKLADSIAALECELGNQEEGQRVLEHAIKAHQREHGSTHSSTLRLMGHLGGLHESCGDRQSALQWFSEALTGYRETLGAAHPSTLAVLGRVAFLRKAEDLASAVPLYEELAELKRNSLGTLSPQTLSAVHTLARVKEQVGDSSGAIALYREALRGRQSSLGDQHQQTLSVMSDLAELFMAESHHESAVPLLRALVSVNRRTIGGSHTTTLSHMMQLGRALEAGGEIAAAAALYREALEGRQELLGPEDPATMASMSSLARVSTGSANQPLLYQSLLAAKQRTLGRHHASTAHVERLAADLRSSSG